MFFKLVPFALWALSIVNALPTSTGCGSALEVQGLPQIDFSMTVHVQTAPQPYKIVNLGVSGSAFVLGENVVTHIGDTDHGKDGLWQFYQVKAGENLYLIKNVGKDAFVSVGENGRLVVIPGTRGVEFAIETAGKNIRQIKKINSDGSEDLYWEAVYDGSSMIYGYVTLHESQGSRPGYQQWTISK
ncbi:hypothetical protein B0H19DRAFT_1257904 [Mycena capillaripes]|nr:hypothetical protein B0H19DRAFT_1257904 [Mycena capillaripes]